MTHQTGGGLSPAFGDHPPNECLCLCISGPAPRTGAAGGWGMGGDVLCPGSSSLPPSTQLRVHAEDLGPGGTIPRQSWFCPFEFGIHLYHLPAV